MIADELQCLALHRTHAEDTQALVNPAAKDVPDRIDQPVEAFLPKTSGIATIRR